MLQKNIHDLTAGVVLVASESVSRHPRGLVEQLKFLHGQNKGSHKNGYQQSAVSYQQTHGKLQLTAES
jgi:hypothetical protein